MLQLVGKRLIQMILIMITVSVLLFLSFEADKLNVASKVLSQYSTLDQRLIWLEQNGYNRPLPVRYFEWVWNAMRGDFGESIQFATPVSKLLKEHLLNTAVLGGLVFFITVSISLVLGVLSGIAEGSARDRGITVLAVLTTSIPEAANSGRNWDYRFCWLRDSYFVVQALNRLGTTVTMERYLAYIMNIAAEAGDEELKPLYGISGRSLTDEQIVESLSGYQGMPPVRRGNQAY